MIYDLKNGIETIPMRLLYGRFRSECCRQRAISTIPQEIAPTTPDS
ncbi:MAG: hypothetical protein QNJ68_16235 [Microcoleaceae cyanobacterium MO_207.B10]|nr:hypothetical protein [Microcoleaceae cyanobacterium MO_207.B10]